MTRLRRILGYQVSIGTLLEFALRVAVPYLLIGFVWVFFHIEHVEALRVGLEKLLPAGAEVAAFVEAAALWPVLLLLPPVCVA